MTNQLKKIKKVPKVVEDNADEKEINFWEVIKFLNETYCEEKPSREGIREFENVFLKYLNQEVRKNEISKKYNIVILYDNTTMTRGDADRIYNTVTKFPKDKPILMILLSNGGYPGSAYLIGKLCREYTKDIFSIVVPRQAKSAATLLSCAANEIHMGSLSELGPIDPQINNMPALGLKNSIEHIAGLTSIYPDSSEMFAKYLNLSIEPIQIGYYERVAESAMQYAENLLSTHSSDFSRDIKEIAFELVYKYKDHGFVIDNSEAQKIMGKKVVKHNTPEYNLGNTVYSILDLLDYYAGKIGYNMFLIGGLESPPSLFKKK